MDNIIEYLAGFYGIKSQTIQLDEEMAELTIETHKLMRERTDNTDALIEEIADVEIMLSQLKILYEIKQENIDKIKEEKLERQMERINKLMGY